ncbi:hypothetical protein Tco_0062496 [Tanacetum coccineum]
MASIPCSPNFISSLNNFRKSNKTQFSPCCSVSCCFGNDFGKLKMGAANSGVFGSGFGLKDGNSNAVSSSFRYRFGVFAMAGKTIYDFTVKERVRSAPGINPVRLRISESKRLAFLGWPSGGLKGSKRHPGSLGEHLGMTREKSIKGHGNTV